MGPDSSLRPSPGLPGDPRGEPALPCAAASGGPRRLWFIRIQEGVLLALGAVCIGGQTAQTCVLTVLEAESRRSRWRPRLSLLGVGAATFALGPHLVISLLVYVQVSPFYRDPSQVGIGPSLVTSF